MKRKRLKIAHVIDGDLTGGAAIAGVELHNQLLKNGCNSSIISNCKKNGIREFINKLFKLSEGKITNYTTFKADPSDNILKKINDFDLIHIHWNKTTLSTSDLRQLSKPMVWTLRDMWALTGGCHYSGTCTKYAGECNPCPILKENGSNTDASAQQNLKKEIFSNPNIEFVTISNWLSDIAQSSDVCGKKLTNLGNNVDTKIFKLQNKKRMREKNDVPQDKPVIVISSQKIGGAFKDHEVTVKVLNALRREIDFRVITIGKVKNDVFSGSAFEYRHFGFISAKENIAEIYACADAMLFTSPQEAFGKVVAEAMACGVPVVATAGSGPDDIIDDKVNGVLVYNNDITSYVESLVRLLIMDEQSKDELRLSCFNKIDEKFSVLAITQKYISLYEKVIENSVK